MITSDEVIGILYRALTKEHWEKGPSVSEAIDCANDWYYNKFGYEGPAASTGIPKLYRALAKKPKTGKEVGK